MASEFYKRMFKELTKNGRKLDQIEVKPECARYCFTEGIFVYRAFDD